MCFCISLCSLFSLSLSLFPLLSPPAPAPAPAAWPYSYPFSLALLCECMCVESSICLVNQLHTLCSGKKSSQVRGFVHFVESSERESGSSGHMHHIWTQSLRVLKGFPVCFSSPPLASSSSSSSSFILVDMA